MTVVGVVHFPSGPTYTEPNVAAGEKKTMREGNEKKDTNMEKKDTDTVLMITLDKNLESKSYPFLFDY
jgi:hypothetical protein